METHSSDTLSGRDSYLQRAQNNSFEDLLVKYPWSGATRRRSRRSLLVVADAEQADELARRGRELAQAGHVMEQEVAVVADREVLQLERADAVLRGERWLSDSLHRQLVRPVAHVLGAGRDDCVVVAAAQLEGDLTGHAGCDPADQRFLEHPGLGVVPLALVEEPSEPAAEARIEVEHVLVV